jgi:MFS family permease
MHTTVQEKPRFSLLYASAFLLFGLNTVTTTAMTAFALHLGASLFAAGLLNAAFIGCAVGLRLLFPRAIDRFGPRLVMAVGALAFVLIEPIYGLCNNFAALLLLRLLQSLGLAAYMPAVLAYITLHSPAAASGSRLGAMRIATTLSMMVGPALAFPLVEEPGYELFFLALTACGLLGGLCLLGLRPGAAGVEAAEAGVAGAQAAGALAAGGEGAGDDGSARTQRGLGLRRRHAVAHPCGGAPLRAGQDVAAAGAAGGEGAGDGARLRRGSGRVAPPLVAQLLIALCYSSLFLYGQVFMENVFPELNSGLVFTLISIGGIAAGLLIGRLIDRVGAARALLASLLVLALAFGLFAFAGTLPLLVAAGLACGLGYYGGNISSIDCVGKRAHPHRRGFAVSLQQSCLDLGLTLGSFVFGLAPVVGGGAQAVFLAMAAALTLMAAYWLVFERK